MLAIPTRKDDDATQNLRPSDKTQRAKKGTKIGLLPKDRLWPSFGRSSNRASGESP